MSSPCVRWTSRIDEVMARSWGVDEKSGYARPWETWTWTGPGEAASRGGTR